MNQEQCRYIETELAEIKGQVNVGKAGLEKAREVLDQAAASFDNCREPYQDAGEELRRLWNRAVFKAIYVGAGLVKGFEYQEPFGVLLACADSSKTVRSGSPYRIRTGGLCLERAVSWAARRTGRSPTILST